MQEQTYHKTNQPGTQGVARLHSGEVIGSPARYLTQLYILLRAARRNPAPKAARVVIALRSLIAHKRGTA